MKVVVATESFDAHLVMARFLAGVADRVARLDRTLALDRAGAGEDRFEQAWSCRSGTGPPAQCTVDPWLVCRSVPFPPPKFAEMRPSARPFALSFQAGGDLARGATRLRHGQGTR